MNASDDGNATYACGIFNPDDCAPGELSTEDRFLALVIIALACALCALCVLVFALTIIVYKLGVIWTIAIAKLSEQETGDARTGLLGGIRSSFSSREKSAAKKGKKASFSEDTSCAAALDVDEEDL